eukprot:6481078-Alexandrium_andersonii.AAC.1
MRRTRPVRRCSTRLAARILPVPGCPVHRQRWLRPWPFRARAELAGCLGQRHHSRLATRH